MNHILQTGQRSCFGADGLEIPCHGSGQDGDLCTGVPWPEPRFRADGNTVLDLLTGLIWSTNANPGVFPCTWQEAMDSVAGLNRDRWCGHDDWRLPNRSEMRSLMSYAAKKPALPDRHPFENVFLGWYWTSTSAAINPAYAWYMHLEGAHVLRPQGSGVPLLAGARQRIRRSSPYRPGRGATTTTAPLFPVREAARTAAVAWAFPGRPGALFANMG